MLLRNMNEITIIHLNGCHICAEAVEAACAVNATLPIERWIKFRDGTIDDPYVKKVMTDVHGTEDSHEWGFPVIVVNKKRYTTRFGRTYIESAPHIFFPDALGITYMTQFFKILMEDDDD